jgi:methylated-DNA-[protein]-cysteine S-methyltransferase
MRCCDVEALWDEMREGVEPRREHILAHLRKCPPCQEVYKQYEGVAYCLECLPVVEPPPRMVPKILEHIRELREKYQATHPDSLTKVESPIGTLYVTFRKTGITSVALDRGKGEASTIAEIERRLRRKVVPTDAAPPWVTDTLAQYFRTYRPDYNRVDISSLTPFEQAALRAAAQIPPGEVRSYGWVARVIGRPQAARAVGRVMARNPIPFLYPCHRVVDSSGALHNYGYGLELKRRLLEMEGYRPTR